MEESSGGAVKVVIALALTAGAIVYAWRSSKEVSIGAQGNNGVSLTIPTPPEEMMNAMKSMRTQVERDPSLENRDWSDPAERAEGERQLMQRSTPEQREAMRKVMGEMRKQMKKANNVLGKEDMTYMMREARKRMPGMPGPPDSDSSRGK